MVDTTTVVSVFVVLFAVFAFLGFYGSRWRRGDMSQIHEWALAGRRLGTALAFFLVGADLYTAYTFVAVPSSLYAKGSIYFFAVPYVAITFAVALAFAPKLWKVSKEKGYVTGSDFVKDAFNSRTLSVLVAITGIIALFPYIALQIVGMQAVLASMLIGVGNTQSVQEISLIIAFLVLAAFTFTSGLRGATLTAVFKDVLIWITVVVVIAATLVEIGGFSHAFTGLKPNYITLPSSLVPGYATLVLASALQLYLYPHAVNGILSAESAHKLRLSTSFLSLYGLGLAFLALFGILVYSVPAATNFLSNFPPSSRGIYVVPSLILSTVPSWFAGVALLGIFVGGLVPAAIMAIAQANLLTRNIIKEFRPTLSANAETRIAKWASAAFKFIALGFVFTVQSTYAIQLQLFGGILIAQLFPSLFMGLYIRWFKREALILGMLAGIFSGLYLVLVANGFGTPSFTGLNSSLYSTPIGSLYVSVLALGLNLLITVLLSAVIPRRPSLPQKQAIPATQ
jgi:SSS family solute:Na+ symporter